MDEIRYDLVDMLGQISGSGNGWTKELNLISWNGGEAKYDIRQWSPNHARMGKGISLTREEAQALKELLERALSE